MLQARAAAGICIVACVVLLGVVAPHYARRTELGYDMKPGKEQPKNGYHFDRNFDPWARDGIAKRGSFTVERVVEHGLKDKFWLVITGVPEHHIRCSIRGFHFFMGQENYSGWKKSYTAKTAIVTGLLPCIKENQRDTVTCNDMVTGERQYFHLSAWKDEDEKRKEPWETDQALQWMKAHGLDDFTEKNAPLHGTSAESKELYDYDGYYSPGEEWLYRTGHPPIDVPPYQEYMGGHMTGEEAKANIENKDEFLGLLKDDIHAVKHSRQWRAYWDAWKAGLDHDNAVNDAASADAAGDASADGAAADTAEGAAAAAAEGSASA